MAAAQAGLEFTVGTVNWSRVIGGGFMTGAVINAVEWGVHAVILDETWTAAFAALGKTPTGWAVYIPGNFIVGVLAVWFYAGILRPRYGPGPKTAARAGLGAWVVFVVIPTSAQIPLNLFPNRLLLIVIGVGLVDVTLGTLFGAWLYGDR